MNTQASNEPKTQPRKTPKNSNLRIVMYTITSIVALCLIAFLVTRIIPKGSFSSSNSPSQATYSAKLICADCAVTGIEINIWQYAGTNRGEVVFSVPHNTSVTVLDTKTADDGRTWYKVAHNGQSGWIPEDFVQR
jgi:hypothetical protein